MQSVKFAAITHVHPNSNISTISRSLAEWDLIATPVISGRCVYDGWLVRMTVILL